MNAWASRGISNFPGSQGPGRTDVETRRRRGDAAVQDSGMDMSPSRCKGEGRY